MPSRRSDSMTSEVMKPTKRLPESWIQAVRGNCRPGALVTPDLPLPASKPGPVAVVSKASRLTPALLAFALLRSLDAEIDAEPLLR